MEGINVRIGQEMLDQIDQNIDKKIGQSRSLFIREAVKERLNRINSGVGV